MTDDRIAGVLFEVQSIGGICHADALEFFVTAFRGIDGSIKQIQHIIFHDGSTRPTAALVVGLIGIEGYGQFSPGQKVLGTGMTPVHGFFPGNLVVGGVLIENMVVALKINQAVGVVDPTSSGTIMALQRTQIVDCMIHRKTSQL